MKTIINKVGGVDITPTLAFTYEGYRKDELNSQSLLPRANGSARKFAEEMKASGVAQAIREEAGNLRYEYFQPLADPETILLIDSWEKARRRWTSTTLHR